ncbi:MAG: DUF4367 domain-containing protein [Eubacterium sp.]|nr:DUF4367 domain-containing protein [Eubacterium sp.]
MKKQDKIQDSPEFQYYKDNFEHYVKEMEEDKESADLKMPDGWEQDFKKTIDDTLDANERKRKRRIVKRIVGVAAAVVLVVGVGNFTAESVSGEGLLEMFMNKLSVGDKQHQTYGTNNNIEFGEDDNQDVLFFSGETLEEVYKQIREELKVPMFYFSYLPDGFSIEEASYDKAYRIVNIKLVKNDEYIYIFQQKQIDDVAFGIVEEKKESIVINNKNIEKSISIYEGFQDNGWLFDIKMNNDMISVDTSISEEECIKIAENIMYY